jgi:hypothetical protein
MPPTISVTIASQELGLPSGDIAQIDANVRRFPREALVLRIVSVLNALAALGKEARMRRCSRRSINGANR